MSASVARPMGVRGAADVPVRVRPATPADNEALIALALACPMEGDVGLCVSRGPDFYALNRLEGDEWGMVVAEDAAGAVVGCVAVAERRAWLHGAEARVCYASDLKVHPTHRGGAVADALSRWVPEECARRGGPDALIYLTILAVNAQM